MNTHNLTGELPSGKYSWYLYADIYCLDYDGNILDGAVAALVAALRNGAQASNDINNIHNSLRFLNGFIRTFSFTSQLEFVGRRPVGFINRETHQVAAQPSTDCHVDGTSGRLHSG